MMKGQPGTDEIWTAYDSGNKGTGLKWEDLRGLTVDFKDGIWWRCKFDRKKDINIVYSFTSK